MYKSAIGPAGPWACSCRWPTAQKQGSPGNPGYRFHFHSFFFSNSAPPCARLRKSPSTPTILIQQSWRKPTKEETDEPRSWRLETGDASPMHLQWVSACTSRLTAQYIACPPLCSFCSNPPRWISPPSLISLRYPFRFLSIHCACVPYTFSLTYLSRLLPASFMAARPNTFHTVQTSE